jgi:PqqD family protein of HPr-rel-A system
MAGPLYHADPPEAVLRVELDGLVLLYHRSSGTTHFLASPAPELLEALGQGSADLAMLAARLAERFEIDQPEALQPRLDELVVAGLVTTS